MCHYISIRIISLLSCGFDSSSLNTISESNHTLVEMNIFLEEGYRLQCCIDELLELGRTQKICLPCMTKILTEYLVFVPVELIPEVLAFTQRDGNQRLCIPQCNGGICQCFTRIIMILRKGDD